MTLGTELGCTAFDDDALHFSRVTANARFSHLGAIGALSVVVGLDVSAGAGRLSIAAGGRELANANVSALSLTVASGDHRLGVVRAAIVLDDIDVVVVVRSVVVSGSEGLRNASDDSGLVGATDGRTLFEKAVVLVRRRPSGVVTSSSHGGVDSSTTV